LYNSVLIETPLAGFFKGSLSHQDLDELNIEIVRNTLYKNYLEEFYKFVTTHPDFKGTPTQEVMAEILQFEADRRAINITLNSFGTELSKPERRKLYPEFGKLYPEGSLMLSRADDIEAVSLAVSISADYKAFFDAVGLTQGGGGLGGMGGSDGKSLEDLFYQKEMELSKLVFTRQFTPAIVYAWMRLKEQVSSLIWI
jgi:V-type H+-transporting ATPase subunit d